MSVGLLLFHDHFFVENKIIYDIISNDIQLESSITDIFLVVNRWLGRQKFDTKSDKKLS